MKIKACKASGVPLEGEMHVAAAVAEEGANDSGAEAEGEVGTVVFAEHSQNRSEP